MSQDVLMVMEALGSFSKGILEIRAECDEKHGNEIGEGDGQDSRSP